MFEWVTCKYEHFGNCLIIPSGIPEADISLAISEKQEKGNPVAGKSKSSWDFYKFILQNTTTPGTSTWLFS